jgi:hypothetical protein
MGRIDFELMKGDPLEVEITIYDWDNRTILARETRGIYSVLDRILKLLTDEQLRMEEERKIKYGKNTITAGEKVSGNKATTRVQVRSKTNKSRKAASLGINRDSGNRLSRLVKVRRIPFDLTAGDDPFI